MNIRRSLLRSTINELMRRTGLSESEVLKLAEQKLGSPVSIDEKPGEYRACGNRGAPGVLAMPATCSLCGAAIVYDAAQPGPLNLICLPCASAWGSETKP